MSEPPPGAVLMMNSTGFVGGTTATAVGATDPDARVVGEAEVIVGAQQHHGLAVEHDARALRAGDLSSAAVQAELLELVEAVLDVPHWILLPHRPAAGAVFGAPSGRGGT